MGLRALRLVRRWGIVAAVGLVLGATIAAYLGVLPSFIRGRYADKVLHFLLFGAVAFFWVLRWGDTRWQLGRLSLPLAVLIPLLVAGCEEAAQALSPSRNADPVDLFADAVGLLTFWTLGRRIQSR